MALARPDPAALAARVEQRADALAGSLVRTWRSELADFAPPLAARSAIRLFAAAIRGESLKVHDRRGLEQLATQQAEDGLPLATLVAAYGIGGRMVLEALREDAEPHKPDKSHESYVPLEQAALVDAASRLLIANAQIVAILVSTYQNESAQSESADEADAQKSAQRRRHRALVRDLLAGITPTRPALLEELGLGVGAVVLALSFAEEEIEETGETRAVQRALDMYFGHTVPMLLEADGGHVLVPHALLPAPQGPALEEIAARIGAVRPSAKVSAVAAHSPAEIAHAARTASEVLRLAGRLGRPAGAYRLADVLLEYHLTRRDESTALLDDLLAPLADRPELLETVRVYLEENYDRRRAARRLSLHPNTVDNRLARTTELTGLDPSTPRGVTLLMTVLALRDLG